MFKPFELTLAEAVKPGDRVLDIGCGTGATTLAIARKAEVESVGVDISEPMLALARQRAEREGLPARFICADAQQHTFASGSFDRIVSRFGIMFFDDPVCAFANLRQAASVGAGLHCIAWRSPAENPFMTTAERVAAPMLPDMPVRKPDAPGQFAFADASRIEAILKQSGWRDVEIRPLDMECSFPATALESYLTRMGPVGMALQQADASTRSSIMAIVRAAFEPFVNGAEVRFTAACWTIRARAS
jgi:SAM-dependent methyltransferase